MKTYHLRLVSDMFPLDNGNISLTTRKWYVSIRKCLQETYHLRLVSDTFPLENACRKHITYDS